MGHREQLHKDGAKVSLGEGLRQYLEMADQCLRELRNSESPFVAVLLQYDEYFRRDLWQHPPPQPSALLLLLNAYQLFLAAARTALSGHPAAIFPLIRTALESASYGFLLEQQPALFPIWANRHRSEADNKACRRTFTFDRAIAGVKEKSPDIHRLAKEAYEAAIDFGAHPNLRGVFGHITMDDARADGMVAVTHASLYSAEHPETVRGLCACLDFGFLIISIIALASPTAARESAPDLQTLNDAKEGAIAAYLSSGDAATGDDADRSQ